MQDGGHFENSKNYNISTINRPISTKLGMVTCLGPPDPLSKYNFALDNQNIIISQKHLHRFQQNFSVLMHNGTL